MEDLKLLTQLFRAKDSIETLLVKDIKKYDLNISEFGVLEYLYHAGANSIQTVCDKLLVANSSMTYVVSQLEKKKFITRVACENDRRIMYIDLSSDGKKKMDKIFPEHEKMIMELFATLSKDEVDVMKNALKKIGFKAIEMRDNK